MIDIYSNQTYISINLLYLYFNLLPEGMAVHQVHVLDDLNPTNCHHTGDSSSDKARIMSQQNWNSLSIGFNWFEPISTWKGMLESIQTLLNSWQTLRDKAKRTMQIRWSLYACKHQICAIENVGNYAADFMGVQYRKGTGVLGLVKSKQKQTYSKYCKLKPKCHSHSWTTINQKIF